MFSNAGRNMQFIVIGHDGNDDGALERRMAARDAHLKVCADSVASGTLLSEVLFGFVLS